MKTTIFAVLLVFSSIIANAQAKKFNWVDWDKVSPAVKEKLKTIKTANNQSVYAAIMSDINDGKKMKMTIDVSIAAIDIDGDGKLGYAVGYSGSLFCGSAGCSFALYEKEGKMTIDMVDHWEMIKPAKGGVISSTGKFFPLEKVK